MALLVAKLPAHTIAVLGCNLCCPTVLSKINLYDAAWTANEAELNSSKNRRKPLQPSGIGVSSNGNKFMGVNTALSPLIEGNPCRSVGSHWLRRMS